MLGSPEGRWRRIGGVAIVTVLLGLAIGTTVAVAVVTDALLLRPLPIENADRVVLLGGLAYHESLGGDPVEWWKAASALDFLCVYRTGDAIVTASDGSEDWLRVAAVTREFFSVFHVAVPHGRVFNIEDVSSDRAVAVLSHSFWRSYFGESVDVLGGALRINDTSYVVIGIAPVNFEYPSGVDVWTLDHPSANVALVAGPTGPASGRLGRAFIGRLRPTGTSEKLRDQLLSLLGEANTRISPRSGVRYGEIINVTPLMVAYARNYGAMMLALGTGAAFVLLISTVNCALFLVSRATSRRRELATKMALGASRGQIVRELVAEAMRLGIGCGFLGVAFAGAIIYTLRLFFYALPVNLHEDLSIATMFLGALAIGLGASLSASVIPIRQLRYRKLRLVLAQGTGRLSGPGGARARRSLIALEVAVAFVLGVGAILCGRTLLHYAQVDLGYEPADTLAVQTVMLGPHDNWEEFRTRQKNLLAVARGLPSAEGAAVVDRLPVFEDDRAYVEVQPASGGERSLASITAVMGNYFGVLKLRIIEGREFTAADGPNVVAISESLARRLWPGGVPQAAQVVTTQDGVPLDVVGVVGDTLPADAERFAAPLAGRDLYRPYRAGTVSLSESVEVQLVVRCADGCEMAGRELVRRLKGVPGVLVRRSASLESDVDIAHGPVRLRAAVWAAYGLVAFAVAIVGVYVVISYLD